VSKTTATKLFSRTISQDERLCHGDAVRAGIASARIEGGDGRPEEALMIMNEWAQGMIDDDTMVARIDALQVT